MLRTSKASFSARDGNLNLKSVTTFYEFIEFCNMIDSEPFICVNMLTGTADEAAAWVEYCNAPSDKPMGALRKQHGYPEPFNVQWILSVSL